jgi:hypothetical protein
VPAKRKGEGDFSQEVIEAFRRRNRAISRRGATVECTPVKEIEDGIESLIGRTDVSIKYRGRGERISIRLIVWGDRWVWIDARRSSKSGWVWESTNEGRFISEGGARDLVTYAEATLSAAHLPAADVARAIAAIWSKSLATKAPPGLPS